MGRAPAGPTSLFYRDFVSGELEVQIPANSIKIQVISRQKTGNGVSGGWFDE
jgi:hypothetical protein